jgi:hypothetical protein
MKLFINAKCSDLFSCTVTDNQGKTLKDYDGYVPRFMPGEHYGDYVELEIDVKTGKITNWKNNAEKLVKEFVENGEE